jgi:1-deoxy-D-xylulose-5-phosphate synthase
MHPICAIYSSFLQRAYDQILEDVCLQNLPVVFSIDRAGIVGADGETHHGVFDLSYLSAMPNMTVLAPSDGDELAAFLRYAVTLQTPCAIRYPRGECHYSLTGQKSSFDGCSRRLADAVDVDIYAVGNMLDTGRQVVKLLKERGITAGLVDVRTVKPLDLSVLDSRCSTIFTLEDGVLQGGFGSALRSAVPSGIQVISFGWPDKFIEHGSVAELNKKYGLDSQSVTERICEEIERKA